MIKHLDVSVDRLPHWLARLGDLRPGLIFKRDAAAEIRRYFIGAPVPLPSFAAGSFPPTPPLDPGAGGPLRAREVTTGVGAR